MTFKRIRNVFLLACLLLLALVLAVSCDSSSKATSKDNTGTQPDSEPSSESETQNTCEHAHTEYAIEKYATCTEKGISNKVCLDCGTVIESISLNTVSHTEEIIPGKFATCSEEGLSEGKKCSVCGTVLVKQEPIGKLNHTERIIPAVSPSCTEKGYSAGKDCSVCGDVIISTEELPALDHNESDWITEKAAEVGVEGSKYTKCTRCGITISRDTIPAIEETHVHEGKAWVVTTPATCTTEGIETLKCDCGKAMDTREIDKLQHTEEILFGVAPTCYSTGLTEGKRCSVCKTVTVAQTTIAKTNHTEEAVLGKAPTCSEYGATDGTRCSVCKESIISQLPIPPTGHSFEAGTCSTCGVKEEAYSVWIVDGLGNPVDNIIVKLLKNGEVVKMYPYSGTHLQFSIEKGTYQIELDLSQLKKSYAYDESSCELTPENTNAVIKLYEKPEEPTSVYVSYPLDADYEAVGVGAGSYILPLTQGDYTFFIFRPTKAAIYTITYESESDLAISYHGGSFFVQGYDLSEDTTTISKYENGLAISVYASDIGNEYAFAVKSTYASSCVLKIANAGSPGTRLEDEPWTPYLEDEVTVNRQLSASKDGTYTTIDLTDTSLVAVLNKNDGYYHLGDANGPIIFIDLTSDSKYVSSIQMICAHQRMGAYIYDVNGNVSEKRSYNELFMQYGMPGTTDSVPEPIRIPLTEKLAEAIKDFGNKNSWWAEGSEANIFDRVLLGQPYNREFAWLLFCGYYS